MEVDLVLSGPEDDGISVATKLGDSHAFLQDPHGGLSQHPYMNPQSLDLPFLPSENEAVPLPMELKALINSEDGNEVDESQEADSTQLTNLVGNLDEFLEGLQTQRPTTTPASKNSMMLTSLFSHQQEAVDFITRREVSGLVSQHSLWEEKSSDGKTYYQHIITGAKSRLPEEVLGGILADDMGLGKSLSMLSAIFNTMDRAQDYVTNAPGTERLSTKSRATVIIVPSEREYSHCPILLKTWSREIERHFYPGCIRYVKYHGSERRKIDNQLRNYDIILTTYSTVMAERRRGISILHKTAWNRLVLDEAHTIRNWSSKQFKAVQDISSKIRWCLTGTPIQNSLDDLGALIRFLNMPIFSEPAIFRKYVCRVRRNKCSGKGEFENLRLIISTICLRRNKSIMPSQGYDIEDRRPEFSQEERQEYRRLELACKRMITVTGKGHGDEKTHHKVMEALLRLRIFCNNGLVQDRRFKGGGLSLLSRPDEVLSFLQQGDEAICAHCSIDILSVGNPSEPDSASLTPCWHVVCAGCVQQHKSAPGNAGSYVCSLCQSQHPIHEVSPQDHAEQLGGATHVPSKIRCLVDDLSTYIEHCKSVIFSFYKSTLDIVGKALETRGIRYLRVDGDIPSKQRDKILEEFQINRAWRVLIMTFSTGAVGLNGLTVANRVHILEPQWNPAVENQAIGRVLRLDQQQKVTIVKYAMRRSIEEVVQSRQMHKLRLAGGGFSGPQERREQRANQLQQLQQYLESTTGE
ncbi:DNA repair and recombination protein RAD5C [Fusarium oxysporum f. sp. albedinis]|nr:DNA repair and recombination protein RAD5C [Fusarium oxysporum f. sp. albedinis]